MIELYGIPNCDTVKKARNWLDNQGLGYTFHDYKKEGADPAKLAAWAEEAGWEKLLNRAGTTFRKLPDSDKQGLDQGRAIAMMVANPSCIKRPVLEHPGGVLVGFTPALWEQALAR